jgi:hypothetical protein
MNLKEIRYEFVDWIHLSHYGVQWRVVTKAAMNLIDLGSIIGKKFVDQPSDYCSAPQFDDFSNNHSAL